MPFQLTGPRDVAYAEVQMFLAKRLGANKSLVASVSVAEAGVPKGAAPPNMTLDSTRLQERYGVGVPNVWEAILATIRG